ncbi:MAG: hypothetical protein OXH15_20500 [Gammaproteobacteria bacterium]|nr:hypothetical protein [Gammaproteobacteria bacterium]
MTVPFGDPVVREDTVGVIGRLGARLDIAHVTTSPQHDKVIVNRGRSPVRYVSDRFLPAAGVGVALRPAAATGADAVVAAESMTVLSVAETLEVTGPDDGTAATLWFNAAARNIGVAVVATNRGDGSTDTTVYEVVPSVRPQGAR